MLSRHSIFQKQAVNTGKFSDFPFWDKTGNITQFWEIIGVFHPILGNLLESKGKKLSQKQEILGK